MQLTEAKPKINHASACLNTIKTCIRALNDDESTLMKEAEAKLREAEQHQMSAAEFVRKKRMQMEVIVRDEFEKNHKTIQNILEQCQSGYKHKVRFFCNLKCFYR